MDTFTDFLKSIADTRDTAELNADILARVRETRQAVNNIASFDEEETCPRCGKPAALGACVESDCPLEGSE